MLWIMLLAACSSNTNSGPKPAPDALGADIVVDTSPNELVEFSDATNSPEQDSAGDSLPLVVMTYNVLCSFCNADYDPWDERLFYFADVFDRHQPDLVGLQELFFAMEVEQILALTPEYSALFWQDLDQAYLKAYADAAIFYRTGRFELLDNGFYWLSPTPDEPLSGGWAESNLARLVAWAHLRDLATGRELYFASTHVDNNTPNQEMSAPLILERTTQWAHDIPAILVGDFNSKPSSPAYAILSSSDDATAISLLNTFDLVPEWSVTTNQDPSVNYNPDHRIDHMFVAGDGDFDVTRWSVDMHVYGSDALYPSDHLAMIATLYLPEGPATD